MHTAWLASSSTMLRMTGDVHSRKGAHHTICTRKLMLAQPEPLSVRCARPGLCLGCSLQIACYHTATGQAVVCFTIGDRWCANERCATPQVSLAKPVIALIGKNYHERQVNMRPNVVQVRAAAATHCYLAIAVHVLQPD